MCWKFNIFYLTKINCSEWIHTKPVCLNQYFGRYNNFKADFALSIENMKLTFRPRHRQQIG